MVNIADVERFKEKLSDPAYIEWGPIIEISNLNIPDFPIGIFPENIKSFIISTATFIQVAVDAVAMNYFAIFASCVVNKFTILVREDWKEYLNLYVLIAAAPSERKSPVFKILKGPLNKALAIENDIRSKAISKQNSKIKLLKKQKQEIEESNVSKLSDDQLEEISNKLAELDIEIEVLEQNKLNKLDLFASDITPEQLARLMKNNNGAVAILSSEGAEVFDLMHGRYSGKSNYDVFLKGYSNEEIKVGRVSLDEGIVVDTPVLTMGLFVQPSVITSLPENVLNRGLMQRFLFCFPKSLAGNRDINSPTIPKEELNYYEESMKRLLLHCVSGEKHQLIFSETAQEKFDALRLNNEKMHLEENRSEAFMQWVGKLDGHLARLTGLLHIMDYLEDLDTMPLVISDVTVERAIRLREYIMISAEKAFGVLEFNQVSKEMDYVLKKIRDKYGEYPEVPYQKLWQDTSGKLKKSKVLRETLKLLEDLNYVKVEKDSNMNNKEMVYIHPDLVKLVRD